MGKQLDFDFGRKVKGIVLSLCDYSGVMSQPWRVAGYEVVQIDLETGHNVCNYLTWMDLQCCDELYGVPVVGIIAQPPCTQFAVSGARWWEQKDREHPELLEDAIELVGRILCIIEALEPQWWIMENPAGRLKECMGRPAFTFNPCEFAGWAEDPDAEAYTKRTCIWGEGFTMPEKRPVEPAQGSKMHRIGGKDKARKRSLAPSGFARAFCAANDKATGAAWTVEPFDAPPPALPEGMEPMTEEELAALEAWERESEELEE